MITLAVTAYQEASRGHGLWIQECVAFALQHPEVGHVTVVDDCSDDFPELRNILGGAVRTGKVTLMHNRRNLGVFGNKLESVYQSPSDWVQLCDSDNIMGPDYYDCLVAYKWTPDIWLCPSFARPRFDYRHLCGTWRLGDAPRLLDQPMIQCCLNTGNQFVHRSTFLEVFGKYRGHDFQTMQPNYLNAPDVDSLFWRKVYDAKDSVFLNKEWLLAGKCLEIAEGLEYEHRISGQSSYDRAPEENELLWAHYERELRQGAKRCQ